VSEQAQGPLTAKKTVLGVSGGIASYKSIDLARLLVLDGAEVRTVLTQSAVSFVQPLPFEVLTGVTPIQRMFPVEGGGFTGDMPHISLSDSADLIIIAPATANIIGKFAQGVGDDFLSTLLLSARPPVLVAPAMNPRMWASPAVQENVAALRAVLIEQGARPASVNLVLSAIRGTMKDAWRLGQIDAEHLARVTDVPNVKSEQLASGRHVEAGEIRRLFEECGHDPVGARDAAMLGLLYGCGLRRAEAVALELADYDDGAVKVRAGKGRKERFVYAANGARAAVEAWIAVRGSWDGALLAPVTKGGHVQRRSLSAQAVMLRLRFLAERAKVSRLSPHDLRRSFVGELLEAGADMSMVQKLAGHADPATTARYDRRPEDAKRRTAGLLHVPYVAAPMLPVADAPADAGDESPPAASSAPPGRGDPPPAAAPG